MNKKDAAAYLGISTRALEYHVTQGNIGRRMVKGKTGDVADFDEGELRALKAKLDAHRAPRGAVVSEGNESREHEPRSLARLSDVGEARVFSEIVQLIVATLDQNGLAHLGTKKQAKPLVPIAEKLTLSITEAAELSGLSKDFLLEAIKKKRLKGAKRGRGWNIKNADLKTFINKL
ncbi:MAG: excisionase family DNA-binding protein [Pyrinomonadaceae bacterium]